MPWDSYDRTGYHSNFKKRGPACIKRAKGVCQGCGVKVGETRISHKGNEYSIRLWACHIDHDKWNAKARLRAYCSTCHGKWDAEDHAFTVQKRKARATFEQQKEVQPSLPLFKRFLKQEKRSTVHDKYKALTPDRQWRERNFKFQRQTSQSYQEYVQLSLF